MNEQKESENKHNKTLNIASYQTWFKNRLWKHGEIKWSLQQRHELTELTDYVCLTVKSRKGNDYENCKGR